jgi:integrase
MVAARADSPGVWPWPAYCQSARTRRHGCATLLTAAGVVPRVVMEILGHSQISITLDVYTHVTSDTQREAISHMDRLLRRRVDRE